MMSGLDNSPILEAVCEFRFPKDTEWTEDLPSILYDKLKDEFPNKEEKKGHGVRVTANGTGVERPDIYPIHSNIFLNSDRTILIQIFSRRISINCLRPYPSWDIFRQKIDFVFQKLQETVEINGIERIGLLYVNKIEIEKKTVDMEEYFTFYPHLSPELPQVFGGFLVGCEFPYNNEEEFAKLEITKTVPSKKDANAFLLRVDYHTAPNHSVGPSVAMEWIENAHGEVKILFNESITEKTRELFREDK